MFISSDLHFCHKRVKEFCPETRPWATLEEMNEELIKKWNVCANKPRVKMFHLGDFSFGLEEETEAIASRLNGDITFIVGNHDRSYTREILSKYGHVKYYDEVKYNKHFFCLMHYPLLDWNKKAKGSVMLHGHTHGSIVETEVDRGKTMDVGWDVHERFLHFDEIIEMMSHRKIKPVGHHF